MTSDTRNCIDLKALRQQLRQRRKDLADNQQVIAAKQLCRHLLRLDCFQKSNHIAIYQAFNGEISLQFFITEAIAQGKQCYLPLLPDSLDEPLQFAHYQPEASMHQNRYGIAEPDFASEPSKIIEIEKIDLVLMPLVGFDHQGTRLGMGGGYYDRTFAQRSPHQMLIGVAHQCQQVEYLPCRDWDVPVDKVVTDVGVIDCV